MRCHRRQRLPLPGADNRIRREDRDAKRVGQKRIGRIEKTIMPGIGIVNHQRGGHISLSQADTVTEHGTAIFLQLSQQPLGSLPLVGGLLIGFCLVMQAAAFSQHFADHTP